MKIMSGLLAELFPSSSQRNGVKPFIFAATVSPGYNVAATYLHPFHLIVGVHLVRGHPPTLINLVRLSCYTLDLRQLLLSRLS